MPHFDEPGLVQSIRFRLYDSVPRQLIEEWKHEIGWIESLAASDPRARELRERIDRYEDAGYGACWLARADIASVVESSLLHFDAERYRLFAWCIMPNHVHVLIQTVTGWPLADVVRSWKSFTAKGANVLLGRRGEFWMPDYYDRFIRDERHLAAAMRYIEENPVAARLALKSEEWRFSSAWHRVMAGGTPAEPGGERPSQADGAGPYAERG